MEGLSLDLDNSQRETRNASSELFRIKSAYEECRDLTYNYIQQRHPSLSSIFLEFVFILQESVMQLDEVRRENRSLSTEIKDIMDQITEGGRSIHEIDKIRSRCRIFFVLQ